MTDTKTTEAAAEADRLAEEKAGNLTTQSGGAVALSDEQMKMMMGDAGKQTFTIREMMVPVLKISNTTSGVMKKADKEYRPEAEEGWLYDSLTFKFLKPPVGVIIVRFQTTYIQSKPKMGPTTKLWGMDRSGYDRAEGGDVGVRTTKEGDEIREVGTYYSMLLRPDKTLLPCLMYLGSTAWKEARKLNTLIGGLEFNGPDGPFIAPPYGQMFTVTTVPASDGQNSWFTWKFDQAGLTLAQPNGMHLYKRAKELETAIDANKTRIVGTQDDERFAEGQQRRAASSESKGPPTDDAPPPASEADYGNASGGGTIAEKAKTAPF